MKIKRKLNVKLILGILILLFLLSSPLIAYSIKINSVKKNLHIDKNRYEEVNYVCFEEKTRDGCISFLSQDLEILIKEHELNRKTAIKDISINNPKELVRIAYNRLENSNIIEPEILLKTMMIKKTLLKDFQKPIEAGIFGAKTENYIIDNFSEPNRSRFVKLLRNQDKNFEEYIEKKSPETH